MTKEIGLEYLDALIDAHEAKHVRDTNDGDNYDPCDTTKERVDREFEEAVLRLAKATKALLTLTS